MCSACGNNVDRYPGGCCFCGREPLTEEEYLARAVPRLAEIDRLDKLCQWEKHEFEVDWQTRERRERRNRLMKQQCADEAAAGM